VNGHEGEEFLSGTVFLRAFDKVIESCGKNEEKQRTSPEPCHQRSLKHSVAEIQMDKAIEIRGIDKIIVRKSIQYATKDADINVF
jgi:hypothetical protein